MSANASVTDSDVLIETFIRLLSEVREGTADIGAKTSKIGRDAAEKERVSNMEKRALMMLEISQTLDAVKNTQSLLQKNINEMIVVFVNLTNVQDNEGLRLLKLYESEMKSCGIKFTQAMQRYRDVVRDIAETHMHMLERKIQSVTTEVRVADKERVSGMAKRIMDGEEVTKVFGDSKRSVEDIEVLRDEVARFQHSVREFKLYF